MYHVPRVHAGTQPMARRPNPPFPPRALLQDYAFFDLCEIMHSESDEAILRNIYQSENPFK